ncbi:50S ribosomal protein L11 methyltransferase [Helicobacter muridarum]|nr:50S ribosomal protein L11 methyltransferase [Helicobacter muridarum]
MSDNKQTTIKFIHKEYRPSFYTVKKLIIPTETKAINSLDSKIGLKLLQKRNNPFINQDYIIRTTTRAKNIITRTKIIESRQNRQLRFYDISKEEQVRVHIFKVPNKDWIKEYKNSIQPIICGQFYISPSWHKDKKAQFIANIKEEYKPNPDLFQTIIIEPSLSFGSGHHATTRMCIMFLSKTKLEGKIMLDVGCGSGILSIIGAKLGAKVYACDTDSYACAQSSQNFYKNNSTYEAIWQGSLESIGRKIATPYHKADIQNISKSSNIKKKDITLPNEYDCICANIVSSVLLLLRQKLIECLKPRGTMILSGILDDSKDKIINAFKPLRLIEKQQIDEWVSLKFIKG